MTEKVYNHEFDYKPDSAEVEIEIKNISNDGLIFIQFNQDLLVPPFTTWEHLKLDNLTRKLIAYQDLNVTRDVLDFKFMKNSDLTDEELRYDLYI